MVFNKEIPNDNGFLTSLDQLKDLFSKGCRQRFKGEDSKALAKWQAESRELFKELLGFGTFESCENKLYEIDTKQCEGYTRIKYVLQTEEKVYLPFFALIPDDMKPGEKRPSVICPQGHFKGFKESVAAVRHEKGVIEDMETNHTHYGEDFVKMGNETVTKYLYKSIDICINVKPS